MKNNKTIKQIISLFFTTSRLIYKQSKEKGRPDFFSFLQLEILSYVKENKEPLMKEVAGFFSITPPSATSLINRLVKLGILKRCFDKNDRRIIRLSLTSKGQKVLSKEFKKVSAQMRKTLMKLSSKERNNLVEIFQKLQKVYKDNQ